MLRIGKKAQAEASYRRAMEAAIQTGARMLELRAAEGLCRIGALSVPELKKIDEKFSEGFDTEDLREAFSLIG